MEIVDERMTLAFQNAERNILDMVDDRVRKAMLARESTVLPAGEQLSSFTTAQDFAASDPAGAPKPD